jgi:hypothetical protein
MPSDKRRYYDAASLRAVLDSFEERFGMTSEVFYAAHLVGDDQKLHRVGRWLRHSWASFYREWGRLSGADLVSHVCRELELT